MGTFSPKSRAALEALSRSQLQVLAKKEGIRANLKSEDIIRRLLPKYPEECPRSLAPSPDGDSPLKIWTPAPDIPSAQYNNSDGENNAWIADTTRMRHSRITAKAEPQSQVRISSSQSEQTPSVRAPTKKDLRFVRRELTELVDEKTFLLEVLDESDRVLRQNLKKTDAAVRDANELVWMRIGIEMQIVSMMKKDRTVWDGTPFMCKGSQKKWRQYIEDDKKMEKKAIFPFFHAPSGFSAGAKNLPFVLLHITTGGKRNGENESDDEDSSLVSQDST